MFDSWHILRTPSALGLPSKAVVLTFDDGPNPCHETTGLLLDVLQHRQVRACFDLVGEQVAGCPELVRRIAADGHLIANHSFSHPFPIGRIRWITEQIKPTERAIGEALQVSDYRSRFLRPPNGLLTPSLRDALRQCELRPLPVTCYLGDDKHGPATADRVLAKLLACLRRDDGGIVVLHDGRCRPFGQGAGDTESLHSGGNRSWVPEAVETLLTTLHPEGFRFDIEPLARIRE